MDTSSKSIDKTMERLLSERLEFETLLSELFATFVNFKIDEIDDKINDAFERIGKHLKIDRCHLVLYEKKMITHAWKACGIKTPVPVGLGADSFPWTVDQLLQNRIVQFKSPNDLPRDAKIDKKGFIKYKTKSTLIIPLFDGQTPVASFSLDQVQTERTWTQDLVLRLQIVGKVLLNVLLKKRSEEALQKAFEEIHKLKNQLENERNYLREEIKLEHDFENIIGQSQVLQYALYKVMQVAQTDTTALILGETGTGKELLARAIHNKSPISSLPLIKVNCASLPSNLIESELFGHEKGAFTGAHNLRKGRFELADGATLFLDEVGELPLETQGKLLRVLQEGEFERMGSSHTIKVDVRIIAATNRNLEEEVKTGRFRKDLWYRLNVFPITAPPLRKHKEDIPILVNWLVKKFCRKMGKQIETITGNTMKALENYQWPGNVRELENVIERAVINSSGNVLNLAEKLEPEKLELAQTARFSTGRTKTLPEMERDYILEILEKTNWQVEGNKSAAQILGLAPSTLRARMRKHGIKRPY